MLQSGCENLLDLGFIISMLEKYLSNLRIDHWKTVKRVMWHLQKTQNLMLIYKRGNQLEITSYSNSDCARCSDSCRSTLAYVFFISQGAIS